MLRVAVVGAGAAGLCAAKHILSSPSSFAPPVVFEATGGVGGTWCYTEHVHEDGRPVYSSMYRDLRTNLPKEVMMFPDFPFASHLSSFLSHQEVLRYLESYCQSHGVQPHIRDGSLGRADVLMFCTGYNFRYPFLDAAQLGLEVEDHLVTPLYRYMVPPAFPSLFFIGICKIICPFPNFNCQVQFALAVLDGSVTLPSRTQMEDEVREDLHRKLDGGVQRRHLLKMDQNQWQYCEELARSAGFPPLPPVVRSLYEEVWRQRQIHPETTGNSTTGLSATPSGRQWTDP